MAFHLPELRPAASTEEPHPEREQLAEPVPLAVQAVGIAVQELEPVAGTAEQGLERELGPTVAGPQVVAMRVQPRQGPAAAAQTVGPVLPGRRQVAGPMRAVAGPLVQLPTVRQQELHQ